MKVKKLISLLNKLPGNLDVFFDPGNGKVQEVDEVTDQRTGAAILNGLDSRIDDQEDERFMWPYNKKEALEELGNLDSTELGDIGDDFGLEKGEDVIKFLKKDEAKLKKVAKDYFHMK